MKTKETLEPGMQNRHKPKPLRHDKMCTNGNSTEL